jgi:undecaprenyl-diphosphatase
VDTLVAAVAQDSIFVVAAGAVLAWILSARPVKVALAVQVVVGLLVVAVLVRLAGAVHTDPRPFVSNPALHPLFAHAADNGFPSDHTAVASAVALLVLLRRRLLGVGLLLLSVLAGAARVAAHVHHTQDIVAGLVIGGVAALVGVLAWRVVERRTEVDSTTAVTSGSPASPARGDHRGR